MNKEKDFSVLFSFLPRIFRKVAVKFFSLIILCFSSLLVAAQSLTPVNLTCENEVNPLGIDKAFPELSWQLISGQGVLQTAYRILVSDNIEKINQNTGNVWDSKKQNKNSSIHIRYAGKVLLANKTYYWKVMVWDNKNNISHWSKTSRWQMGLLAKNDWKNARWIAYSTLPDSLRIVPGEEGKGKKKRPPLNDVLPLFRKNFAVKKQLNKATVYISGLGQFEMHLNGDKVGDHFLDPTWTEYKKEAMYVTFDVTKQLKPGENAIGVMLGNGFYFIPRDRRYRKLTDAYGFPKMICRLTLEYKDGSTENIVSDASWKTHKGPVTYTSIYGGEDYNANLEQPGWDTALFNDKNWKQVKITDGPPELRSQMSGHVKVQEIFTPKKITKINDSMIIYDLGQNASGIPEITVKGNKGDTVRIVPAELLNENGTVNQRATGSPHYDEYILKGGPAETWHPRFTYYGFRYVQIERAALPSASNLHHLPTILSVKGLHIRNDAKMVGTFECSNELFNRTFTLINWAIKSNLMNVLTDCPHREKLGWLEQAHLMGNSIQYNYDVANYFRKTVHDMMAAQTPEGLIPEIAPEYVVFDFGGGMFRDSPEWGSAAILLPWYLYRWYGDSEILKESYPMMKKYIAYLQTKAKDNILSQGLGDWYDLGPKDPGVSQLTAMGITGTAIYYYDLNVVSKIARLVGKEDEVSAYDKLAAEVRQSFNEKFFNKETKEYGTGSQTANAMAVYMKLVEPQYKEAVVQNIVKDIRQHNNSLTSGDIGYRYLLKVLDDEGRSGVIYEMNNRTDVPGYGYQLAKGATSLTESWQALPSVSNNHLMLGHLMEWFYSGLAGIRQSDSSIAFKNIIIRPEPVGDITSAKASYQSVYGLIASEWEKEDDDFKLKVTIPANTSATIYLPADSSSVIEEGNSSIHDREDVKLAGYKKGKALVKVGSGNYIFIVK
jgi:alpha-L-rhamnosidase